MSRRRSGGHAESDLATALRPLTSGAIRDQMPKTARIVFQVPPAEKREMAETASAFGLTLTDYFRQLHQITRALGHGPKGRAK